MDDKEYQKIKKMLQEKNKGIEVIPDRTPKFCEHPAFLGYTCRFCHKPMKLFNKELQVRKDEFHLGRIEFWKCECCGVNLKEYIQDYGNEQMKEIHKEFKDKPFQINMEDNICAHDRG